MSEPVVLRDTDARGVATLTLNRPGVNNAYDGEMIDALIGAFADLGADRSVRVVVLRGNGRHFQAGADLTWIDAVRERSPEDNVEVSRRTAEAVRGLNEFAKPTVALVHGGCFGGGVGIVASCDVVVAERTAIFAITEARWGLIASIIVPQLNGAIGARHVRRYAQSCERFDAERAAAIGLVHELCEPGALDDAAAPIVDALLRSAPEAMAETKALALAHSKLVDDDAYVERLVQRHSDKRGSDEAREGLASFRAKRDPDWYPGPG